MDKTQIVIGFISAFIGGIIAVYLRAFLEKRKDIELNFHKITEDKYRSLLVFMACALDINKKRYFTISEQTVNKTAEDYLNHLKEYYYHSILYSSDDVIVSLGKFIKKPSKEAYVEVAKAMRKELWGRKTKLTFDDIPID